MHRSVLIFATPKAGWKPVLQFYGAAFAGI
jgi:hypothetical protein